MITKVFNAERRRYLVIGGSCALLNNALLIGGDALGLHYAVTIVAAFILVLPISYIFHARWTFFAPISLPALWRYVLGSLSGLGLASFTIWLLNVMLGIPMWLAAPLATAKMVIYNFLMTRWSVRRSQTFYSV